MQLTNQTVDQVVASAASKTAITTAGTTAIWGVVTHETLFGFLGVMVAVITMIINWYYKRKSDRLDEELKRKADARESLESLQRAEERALRIEIMRSEQGMPKYQDSLND